MTFNKIILSIFLSINLAKACPALQEDYNPAKTVLPFVLPYSDIKTWHSLILVNKDFSNLITKTTQNIQTFTALFMLPYLDQSLEKIKPNPNPSATLSQELDYLLGTYGHLYYARMIQGLWNKDRIPPNILLSNHYDWHPFVKRLFGYAISEWDITEDPVGNHIYWNAFPFEYLSKLFYERLQSDQEKFEYTRKAALRGDIWVSSSEIPPEEAIFENAMQSENPLALARAYHDALNEEAPTYDPKNAALLLELGQQKQQDWARWVTFDGLNDGQSGWSNQAHHYVSQSLQELSPWGVWILISRQTPTLYPSVLSSGVPLVDVLFQGLEHLDLKLNNFTHPLWEEPTSHGMDPLNSKSHWQLCTHLRIFTYLTKYKGREECIEKARTLAIAHKVNPFLKRKHQR